MWKHQKGRLSEDSVHTRHSPSQIPNNSQEIASGEKEWKK